MFLSLSDVKSHLIIDETFTADDNYLVSLIVTAEATVENIMDRQLSDLQEVGIMPAWAAMIIISRDLVISSLRMVAAAEGRVIQAVFSGKLKTTVHIICITALMVNILPNNINTGLVWAMTIMSLYSGIDYIAKNIDILKDSMSQKGGK